MARPDVRKKTMRLSAREIEVISGIGNRDRYVYFIKRVADAESAWVLDDDGFALSCDGSNNDFIVLWPAREYAEACAIDEWSRYKPKEIELDFLLYEFLPNLSNDGLRIGVFMVPSTKDTPIVSADELLADLKNECEKYI